MQRTLNMIISMIRASTMMITMIKVDTKMIPMITDQGINDDDNHNQNGHYGDYQDQYINKF